MYQITECDELFKLFIYNLTIILFVGSIVVVGNTKSQTISTGIVFVTHPKAAIFVEMTEPMGEPAELASCIVAYTSMLSLEAGFKKCK